jgi:hypothetical protein
LQSTTSDRTRFADGSVRLPLPARDDPQFTAYTRSYRTYTRLATEAERLWEQACRRRWRALALVIKAKLEAAEAGITEFEAAFLAHIVLPDGETGRQLDPAAAGGGVRKRAHAGPAAAAGRAGPAASAAGRRAVRRWLRLDSETHEVRLVVTDLFDGRHTRTEYRCVGSDDGRLIRGHRWAHLDGRRVDYDAASGRYYFHGAMRPAGRPGASVRISRASSSSRGPTPASRS